MGVLSVLPLVNPMVGGRAGAGCSLPTLRDCCRHVQRLLRRVRDTARMASCPPRLKAWLRHHNRMKYKIK